MVDGSTRTRCVHDRSESVMCPSTVAQTTNVLECSARERSRRAEGALDTWHWSYDHAKDCQRVRHRWPADAHSATYPGVTSHSLTRSPALIALRQMLIRRGPWAGAHAPHNVHTRSQASLPQPACHAMPCPLSRSLAPSLPLSPFVVTPRGTRPTFPNWASRS